MSRLGVLATALVVLALPPPAAAATREGTQARQGIAKAVAKGSLTREEAKRYRAAVARAESLQRNLPAAQAQVLRAVLAQVSKHSGTYTPPRALTLFGMLEVNSSYLAQNPVPPAGRDVEGPEGVVYRAFTGRGLQFHPLANAARLNAHVSAKRAIKAERLAMALERRGVARLRGRTWEYWFDYGSIRAPWSSGMAQAVMAQAFARTATLLEDPAFAVPARRAYATVPWLTMPLSAGPWVHLYEGSRLVVLNAQLQAAVSVAEYAGLAGDEGAAAFAARLRSSASTLLPAFDTGYWSHYSLGRESTLAYQRYVVTLLRRLGRDTGEPSWIETAERFAQYEFEPPQLRGTLIGPTPLYPAPRDGHRDDLLVRFWVSKTSDVTLVVAGQGRATMRAGHGWHTISWKLPRTMRPTSHAAKLVARDVVGNRGETDLPEVVVVRDTEPPRVDVAFGGGRLHWRARDQGSHRLKLNVVLARAGRTVRIDLGTRPLSGSWAWKGNLPRGRWEATLVAWDASGNRTRVPLGSLPKRGPGGA